MVAAARRKGRIAALPAGTILYHVHRAKYDALDFNPHRDGVRWRFSPIRDDVGAVPSWYGSLTPEGALCETVFRDLVKQRHGSIYRKVALQGRVVSSVRLLEELRLLELHGDGLLSMRFPKHLTQCEPYGYRHSAAIGQRLYRACRDVAGFVWRSRINDAHLSLVLYSPRTASGFAEPGDSLSLDEGLGLAAVMDLASRINCTIV